MSTFILIHGAWHSRESWYKVIPLLEKEGHKVIAPDLPGLGQDPTNPATVTMQGYINFVSDIVNAQEEKVILVGHSMAGGIISQVAEKLPTKIEKLIYLCAFYMQNGESLIDIVTKYPTPNKLEFDFYEEGKLASVKEHLLDEVFYNDCTTEDRIFIKSTLRPQSMEPFGAKIKISKENYGTVPRTVIECTKDNGIPIEAQRMMTKEQPPQKLYSLDTGHSPFFSNPQGLADILNKEAN